MISSDILKGLPGSGFAAGLFKLPPDFLPPLKSMEVTFKGTCLTQNESCNIPVSRVDMVLK